MIIDALVEGYLDEAVAIRLITCCGHQLGVTYGKRGWTYLRDKAAGFNRRAQYGNPILMLVDFMDTGLRCPPEVPAIWLPQRHPRLLLRTVVREIESWLLADGSGIAHFLGVAENLVPPNPESLDNPKQTLINLTRHSRKRALRDAVLPPFNVSASVGPDYNAVFGEFVTRYWDIEAAQQRAPSLSRCMTRLKELQ